MELERSTIKKTFFGNYRPEEVDRLLDTAEELLAQREAARAAEAARAEAEMQEAGTLAASLKQIQEELDSLREENTRQAALTQTLCDACQEREDENRLLCSELAELHAKLEETKTELDLARSQASILDSRVARQRRELEEKDQLLLADPVGEASKRAEQIIRNATNMSKQMLDDAESMRSRALAAVRSAYFNTMGFRQNLEERFFNLQNDLNQAMLTLRAIETEDEFRDQDIIQEK